MESVPAVALQPAPRTGFPAGASPFRGSFPIRIFGAAILAFEQLPAMREIPYPSVSPRNAMEFAPDEGEGEGGTSREMFASSGPAVKLTFLGTRGYIQLCSPQHRRHSSLLLSHKGEKVMIDCGADWLGMINTVSPDAIVITHAHRDHAWGLAGGACCPVYATEESGAAMASFPVESRRTVSPRKPFEVRGMLFEAFPVIHSIRAPAVGYRISAGKVSFFYVPDVIDIADRKAALTGIRLYVGDGAALIRPIVRRAGEQLFGHTTVRAQLDWCEQCGVGKALFTHCGSEIVGGDEKALQSKVQQMGLERAVHAAIAFDGMKVTLR